MRRVLLLVLGVVAASSPAFGQAPAAVSADARLRAIYSTEWAWRQAELGDDDDTGGPLIDHLPHVDPASQTARLARWQAVLADLDALALDRLSPAERVNYAIYRPQIEALIAEQRYRAYEMPVNSDQNFWSGFAGTADRPFRGVADYRAWIHQMQDIPRYFDEQVGQMRAGLARGFTPPRVTLAGRDGSIATVVEAAPGKTYFYRPFVSMDGVDALQAEALRAEALITIRDVVQPAYRKLLAFFRDEYVPGARTDLAAQSLPDGVAYYQAQIREYTTLERSPAEIHAYGVAEVERLHAQMVAAMHRTGFTGDFAQFLGFLRSDPRFQPATADELLMRAAWIAKRFDDRSNLYFGYLPRRRFGIRPVPAAIAPFYTAGRGGPEVYLVNTYDLPSRPLYNLTALTLHESAPGHAWQMGIALEHADQPEFRRHTYISAYGEGWALYCEWLGEEMGLYDTDYDRFGMLGYQIWRAARLVVDTGIHTQGWTRDQAVAYLRQYTALPEHEIDTEVDRYISWPGQALSYYLGESAILAARTRAERALGSQFNLRAFHDTVLELGSVPLAVLEARIDRFIAEGGRGPYPDLE